MEDQRSDVQRAARRDRRPRAPHPARRSCASSAACCARAHFKVTAVIVDEEMIDVEPGDTTGTRHAIAFDLGTTTVVATLLDLESGQPLAVQSLLNRQQPFGGDVISRISATMMDPDALDTLRSRAHETMAALAGEVCEEAGIAPEQVYEITVCGNATMMHLALGIDPEPLSMAPFTVTTHELPETLRQRLRRRACTRARRPSSSPRWAPTSAATSWPACSPPGSRATAACACSSTSAPTARSRWAASERVLATAAPAGPAFEAAQIRCGMRAAEGAIEGVRIEGDELELQVIGDAEPVGLCGSGLVDCVAELVRAGLLDHSGRFIPDEDAAELAPAPGRRLTKIGEERVFVMHWRGEDPAESIFLSQRDVRELQFAKASIATGWNILLRELGVEPADIQQVLLAGSFGAYLSPASAVRIGLVPRLALPRIVSAGNVAGEGAKIVALSHSRARRGALDRARGRVRRAVRPRRLQRPVHRRAGVPGMSAPRSSPAARSRSTCARSRAAAAGTSTSCPCPRCCTTAPSRSPGAVAELADELRERYDRVVLRLRRLRHLRRARRASASSACAASTATTSSRARRSPRRWPPSPGTYFLTDFLARTFEHTVVRELGLDRHPELRDDYFGAYRRVVWLAQRPHAGGRARRASGRPRASGCRSRCARSATPASSAELERLVA